MNINEETGIRFGYISCSSLYYDVIEQLQSCGVDLRFREAQDETQKKWEAAAGLIDDEIAIHLAELDGHNMTEFDRMTVEESLIAQHYGQVGFVDREDYVTGNVSNELEYFYCDEPVHEGELQGVKYRTSWLGGALNLWVFESPFTGNFRECSPCVPGAADLDNPDNAGVTGYDVPPDWRWKEPT